MAALSRAPEAVGKNTQGGGRHTGWYARASASKAGARKLAKFHACRYTGMSRRSVRVRARAW
eukprot:1979688-Prymnesium_polylepis.1